MKKKILLTGASGFIGNALATYFSAKGHNIIGLTRRPPAQQSNHNPGIQWVQWDGKTLTGWESHLENAWAVINLAGEPVAPARWTASKKEKIISSRVNAGKLLTEALEKTSHKPQVFIQASAIGFYGPSGDGELDETAESGQGFLAAVVRQWEDSSQNIQNTGIRQCIIRIGLVLGKNGGAFPRMRLPFRFFAGGPVGSGKQWMSWIHINDLIQAIDFLMNNDQLAGIFNLTAPEPATGKTFAKTLGKILHRPSFFPVPGFVLKLIFGQMAEEALLSGQRVLPSRLTKEQFPFAFPRLSAALEDLC
ncbi:MAG: TIGR01777 family protein [bacterium]|nr:TIGR01777 family protein [bacterium]